MCRHTMVTTFALKWHLSFRVQAYFEKNWKNDGPCIVKVTCILVWCYLYLMYLFSLVQSLSRVQFFATPWIAAHQASLSITNSRSSPRLTSIESVMPSSHLILCHPLLLLPPILPSIRVFSNESTLHMRWPKYWGFSFSIIPSKEIPGLISFRHKATIISGDFHHWSLGQLGVHKVSPT